MSSHARPGSAPRPADPPHPDAPYRDAGYDGRDGYDHAAYAAGAYGSHGESPYGESRYAESPYGGSGGRYAEAAYEADVSGTGGAFASGRAHGSSASSVSPHGSSASSLGAHGSSAHGSGAYASTAYASPAHGSTAYGSTAYGSTAYGSSAHGGGDGLGGEHMAGGGGVRGVPETDGTRAGRPSRAQARAASRARARRRRLKRTGFLGVGSVAAVAVMAVAGFVNPHHGSDSAAAQADTAAAPVAGRTGDGNASRSVDRTDPATTLKRLPGLGPGFLAKVPAGAQQVLLVTGKGKDQNTGTAVLYTRTAAGRWIAGPTWAARNAKDGWTTDHHAGDLHSPIGVFSLTDAGGLDPNPGTKLPYTHSSAFQAPGTGFEGESLADAFDYVVAINYNHVPGTSPLSEQRPMGADRGGGIWVHVDHGGPTHGCVALTKDDMRALLEALDPAKHPVIVMGDAASLAQ
jgi:L,D-peptidoglycan transpeptidase YkuD (ErfK/YbiS/YcfS/YnhG family)